MVSVNVDLKAEFPTDANAKVTKASKKGVPEMLTAQCGPLCNVGTLYDACLEAIQDTLKSQTGTVTATNVRTFKCPMTFH